MSLCINKSCSCKRVHRDRVVNHQMKQGKSAQQNFPITKVREMLDIKLDFFNKTHHVRTKRLRRLNHLESHSFHSFRSRVKSARDVRCANCEKSLHNRAPSRSWHGSALAALIYRVECVCIMSVWLPGMILYDIKCTRRRPAAEHSRRLLG
jgi:hypothetical protein